MLPWVKANAKNGDGATVSHGHVTLVNASLTTNVDKNAKTLAWDTGVAVVIRQGHFNIVSG